MILTEVQFTLVISYKNVSCDISLNCEVSIVEFYISFLKTQVDQGSLGLPRSTLISGRLNSTAVILNAYARFASKVARVIRDTIQGGTNDSSIDNDVYDMIQFEIEVAKVKDIIDIWIHQLLIDGNDEMEDYDAPRRATQ